MCKPIATLYTKAQLQNLLHAWECKEPLPTKKQTLYVTWAHLGWNVDLAVCEWTDLKSDVGERLYRVTMSSKNGRNLVAQEEKLASA